MGNKRKLIYFVIGVVAIVATNASEAHAQQAYSFGSPTPAGQNFNDQNYGNQPAARAYYQPQARSARPNGSQYGQHQATAYRDTTYVAPQPQTRGPDPRAQQSFGPRKKFNSIGFRVKQDDPFGESQATDPFGETAPSQNTFDPFAEPGQAKQDPFVEGQMAPRNVEPRLDNGGGQLTDPFADPPGVVPPKRDLPTQEPQRRETQQRGVDPILPGDADPNLDTPSLNGGSVLEKQENEEDYPPGTIRPEDERKDPFKDPVNDSGYNRNENRYIPPAGVYRPPGSRRRTPAYDEQYPQPAYQQPYQQPYRQPAYQQPPAYQPAYQPIPGQAYPSYAPPSQQLVTAPPPAALPQANDVYIPTVAPVNPCSDCVACQSGGQGGCNSGCGAACLGCETNRCPNFYFSMFGGWTSLGQLTSDSGLGEFRTDDGAAFGVALGRRNGRNLRTELEFSTRSNDVTGFFDGSSLTSLSGDITSYAGMANAYWEFIDVPTRLFKPYVGIGAGFISIDSDIRDSNSRSILESGTDNDTSLALQYMVGVNYKAYRNVDLFVEYRYLRADTFRLDTTVGTSDRYPYQSDNVFVGLRWKF